MKTLDRIFNYLLYATCLILGALIIVYCLNRAVLASQSPAWAAAPGQIVASYTTVSGKNNGIINPHVIYRYTVDGVAYTGTEISYGYNGFFSGESREMAEAKAAQYPNGAIVKVFYKPSSPAVSCLETGGSLWSYGFPAAGGIFLFALGIWGIRRLLKPKAVLSVKPENQIRCL
ncbi:MAG TPA: DUF3592 domain-containing protein [Pyrinomonadaceae bacterium]|jgi:hypothetical protein